ncbi:GNAT family N-acetyltransferase [Caproiciproducens sp. NJN-50]|uniref:GNAT family N-acetyltransferase n=1 Tax=Caproiciproducens sp. NJN-50 TaxID=2507162 RepID=UPI000FFE034A|nr:GNAT family N-acetyltransferase [Caproiciproducens sp. NJN-50]QAT48707.1 GNAT family N-acetyltransferase [Caproiciproducens sp. NJN-50]
MNIACSPWLKLRETLTPEDRDQIEDLQMRCGRAEPVALKLELDYKLAAALNRPEDSAIRDVNEFLYFDGQRLAGYLGICSFGGPGMPLEATGMVAPEERRRGIFTTLYRLALAEGRRRSSAGMLVLCDRKSDAGRKFIEKIGAAYHHSEYEMVLNQAWEAPGGGKLCGVTLRKATNADAREIAEQDSVYFSDEAPESEAGPGADRPDVPSGEIRLPEEEEKKGFVIWLAERDGRSVGKVNLELGSGSGGIYGLGVKPEFRGRGFGRSILLQAVEKLKEANAKKILLQVAADNAKALNLYTSCGFCETSTMDYFKADL